MRTPCAHLAIVRAAAFPWQRAGCSRPPGVRVFGHDSAPEAVENVADRREHGEWKLSVESGYLLPLDGMGELQRHHDSSSSFAATVAPSVRIVRATAAALTRV